MPDVSIIILKRSASIPKNVWREPGTTRTFHALHIEEYVAAAWMTWMADKTKPAVIQSQIDEVNGQGQIEIRRTNPIEHSGVFRLYFSDDTVKVRLAPEACRNELHVPGRRDIHIARLQPWQPIRVLLNGKGDWHSDRYYFLQEYYLVLARDEMPVPLPALQTVDLQMDRKRTASTV